MFVFHDPLEQLAYDIACASHAGQVDRDGRPHIEHVLRVAVPFHDVETRVVGLLHDVLEDDPEQSPGLLIRAGIPADIVSSVGHMTRRRYETYSVYIDRLIKWGDERAIRVKLEDATDNWRRCRAARDRAGAKKYRLVRRRCTRAILDAWYVQPRGEDDPGEARP